MTDGYGLLYLLQNIIDNPNENAFRHLPKKSILQKMMMYFSMPYHVIRSILKAAVTPKEVNLLSPKGTSSMGIKQGHFAK